MTGKPITDEANSNPRGHDSSCGGGWHRLDRRRWTTDCRLERDLGRDASPRRPRHVPRVRDTAKKEIARKVCTKGGEAQVFREVLEPFFLRRGGATARTARRSVPTFSMRNCRVYFRWIGQFRRIGQHLVLALLGFVGNCRIGGSRWGRIAEASDDFCRTAWLTATFPQS